MIGALSRAAVILAGCLGVLAVPGAAGASAAERPTPTTIAVGVEIPAKPELPPILTARLARADGAPVSEQQVTLSLGVDFLGREWARLGEAVTDAAGVARLPMTPGRERYAVRAAFAGSAGYAPSEDVEEVRFPPRTVRDGGPLHVHPLLDPVRVVMPPLISGLVAIIWVVLIGLAVWTVRVARKEGGAQPAAVGRWGRARLRERRRADQREETSGHSRTTN
jgi:hypothetical protein